MESEGRAAVQSINDQTEQTVRELVSTQEKAQQILEEVRQAAAEQGVSQQASYFAEEAKTHGDDAEKWRKRTFIWAGVLVLYGLATLFLHRIPWITPANIAESIQVLAGKLLIFFVLSFMLILSARNFMANRHNAVVNKQRQNALQTFNALVEASSSSDARDIVLNHAAGSIFRPQETGYTKVGSPSVSGQNPLMELLPRATMRVDGG